MGNSASLKAQCGDLCKAVGREAGNLGFNPKSVGDLGLASYSQQPTLPNMALGGLYVQFTCAAFLEGAKCHLRGETGTEFCHLLTLVGS